MICILSARVARMCATGTKVLNGYKSIPLTSFLLLMGVVAFAGLTFSLYAPVNASPELTGTSHPITDNSSITHKHHSNCKAGILAVAFTTAQSGDWAASTTWVGGVVPGAGADVTIAHAVTVNTSNYSANTNAITINSGASLSLGATDTVLFNTLVNNGTINLGSAGVLAMYGTSPVWTNNGSFVYGTGTVSFNGTTANTVNGQNKFYNVVVKGNVSLAGDTVYGAIQVIPPGSFTGNPVGFESLPTVPAGQAITIYASPSGSGSGSGFSSFLPVSITRARAVVKNYPANACTVLLQDGTYYQLTLDSTDTRSVTYPVLYKALNKGAVKFQPLKTINRADFQNIPDSIKSRIVDSTAKTKVKQLNLNTYAFSAKSVAGWPNVFADSGRVTPQFYVNANVLPLSRYPNSDYMKMNGVIVKGNNKLDTPGVFYYSDLRTKYWTKAIADGGLWLAGNWCVPWVLQYIKTASIDTINKIITQTNGVQNGLGYKFSAAKPPGSYNEPYFVSNIVEEIDTVGEWSINFRTKMLYMWVPDNGTIQYGDSLTMPAISVTKANNTQFQNIYFEGGAGSAIVINNATNVRIAGCDFTGCTNDAVLINDSYNCTVQSNDFHQVGAGGVKMNSSTYSKTDVFTLKRNNHTIINNYFYDYAQQLPLYNAAIDPGSTIGNYIANNKVRKSPHIGIAYGFGTGNNSLFEYNEVDSTVMVFHDMGAMYGTGRYIDRGHKFNHNYLHDNIAGVGANGLYLDNFTSGDTCVNNIVANVLNGMVNNGGVGNRFFNNVVINALRPVSTNYDPDSTRYVTLKNTYYNANAANFRNAYPELVDAVDTLQRDTLNITSEYWSQFRGNAFFTFSPTNNNSIFTYVPDNNVFNADGTNNNAWCYNPNNDPFKKWRTIFLDNFKSTNKLKTAIYPFQMDSLRVPGILNLTGGNTDWHINRIGLYTDSFRTSLGNLGVNGIAPKMKMTVTSNNNHLFNTDTTTLTVTVTNPNINNCISSYQFFDNNTALSGLTINKTVVSYDTVVFTTVWPNVPKGLHSITFKINDAPNWQYSTAPYAFSTDTAVYWTGAVSSAWTNGANWSSGTIPTASQPVVIPGSGITNWPVIAGDSVAVHRINIKSGASLTINANLQVAGPIKFDGNNITISGNATIKTSDTTLNPLPSGINWGNIKVMYNSALAPQTIVGGSFGGLLIQQSIVGNTDYASGDIQVNGNWQLAAGDTLDMGIYAFNGNVTAPTSIGGCVKTQSTAANPLPAGINYSGTVFYNAVTGTQTIMLGSYNHLNLSGSAASDRVLAPGGRITITGNLIGATGNMTATNDTLVLAGNHSLTGNIGLNHLIINNGASVSMPAGTLNVSGNFNNNGSFTATGGTVQLTGTKQLISGANTFNHFAKSVSVTDTLTLPAGLTQTINGNLLLNGAAGKVLYLLSSTAGSKALIAANGNKNVSFTAIKDNQQTGTTPIVTVNSYDFGNNINWNFGASTYTWVGNVDSTWNNANNWIPAQLPQTTDSVVVDKIGTNQLVLEQSKTIAGLTIKQNNAVSIKANTLTLNGDLWCDGTLNSTTGSLIIADTTTIRGNGLGVLNLYHLTINTGALLTSGSNVPINISGNWNNNGNYVTGSEEVSFTGSVAQAISKTGGETFGKLTISNSSNTVTANSNITLTSVGRIKINTGANFDVGANLLQGGAATNFTEGTGKLFTRNTSANPVPASKTWSFDVVYNNPTGGQSVQRGTYNGVLAVTNTSGLDTLTGNITVGNAINLGTGAALDAKLYTISGTLTGSTGNGTLYLGANNSTAGVYQIPLAKTWSGTVIFNGVGAYINHRIPTGNYNNLQLDVAPGGIQFGNQTTETGTIRVAGTLTTTSSTFTPNQTTFEFSGSNQSIPAGMSFYNLTLSGSGTVFPSGNINISNSFNPGVVNGTNQGTITFNGTGSQTIPGFNYNNLTVSGTRNGNLILANGATIGIAGSFTASATFTSGGYITTNNTVHFNGNVLQTIPRLVSNATYNYGSIRISNNAGVNFGANLAVDKDVILNAGTLNINSKIDSIGGNIVVIGGKLNARTGAIVFNGTTAQTIDANAFAGDSVTVLTINNSAGVTSNANINIFSALNLTNGVLTANANGITMRGAATISGASTASYINGRLTLPVSNQAAVVFPLGSGGVYRPVTFNYASAPGSQTVGIKPFEGLMPNIPDSISTGRYGIKYWNIQQSATGIPYFIGINVGSNTPSTTTRMLRREGSGTISLAAISYANPSISNSSQFTTTQVSNDIAIGEYQIPVTISGATPNNKEYDGTNAATFTGTLQGVFAGDAVTLEPTAYFNGKHVGNNLPVTAACTLTGSRAKAYVLTSQPVLGNANITPKPISVTAVVDTITYNGSTVSAKTPAFSLVAGDAVATNPTQSFDNKHVGNAKLITPSGLAVNDGNNGNNYAISYVAQNIGVVKPKPIVVTSLPDSKTYDGNTISSVVPTVNVGGLVNGDIALFSQTFAAKNIGAGIPLIPAGYINDGNNGNNYIYSFVNNITGVIQAKIVQATAIADNRLYDATTNATASVSLNGVVIGDAVTASYTTANFNSKNAGTNKPVQVSGLYLTGADAANYQLLSTTVDTLASISPLPITLTVGAENKSYDGNTNAQPSFSTNTIYAGDMVGFTYTNAMFNDKNVGTNKTVTVAGISLTGTDAANYALPATTANPYAAITTRTLTVRPNPSHKVYDGNSNASVILNDDRLLGDNLTILYNAAFNNKNVGNAKTITVSGLTLSGTDAANYSLAANTVDTFANIIPASLTVRAVAANKNYDGTTAASVGLIDNRIAGDVLTANYASAVFADKQVGNAKTVTVSGISLNGADAINYNLLSNSVDTFANILPATVTLTASNQSKNVQGYLSLGNTAFTATGLLQGDNITSVTLLTNNLPYSPTTDNIGTYAIVPSAAQGSGLSNYAINYVNGTLTVKKTNMYVWTGAADASWSNVANWNLNSLPTAIDSVTIAKTSVNQLSIDQSDTVAYFAINAGNTVSLNNNTLTVTGNWVNNGTFIGNTGTNVFAYATTTNGNSNFNHVVINNGASLTFASASNNSVSGNWTNNGTFTAATGTTVTFNGTALQTISKASGTENFNSLSIVNNTVKVLAQSNIALSATGTLAINNANLDMGTYSLSGGASASFTSGTNGILSTQNQSGLPLPTGRTWVFDVVYNHTNGNQTIVSGTYNGSLSILNTTGLDTLMGNTTINSSFILGTGAALDAKLYSISGNLTGSTGNGTLYLGGNNATAGFYQIPLNKNWGGKVVFNGVGAYINHRIPPGNYNDLQLDVSPGATQFGNQSTETGTIKVAGTLTTSSTQFTPNQTTFEFSGTNQSIPAAMSFFNLRLSGSGTTFANGNINIANNFIPGSISGATQGTITFNGTGAQTVPTFNYNHLAISGARTTNNVTLANGGTIGVAGTFTTTATFTTGGYIVANNTLQYNGVGAQAVTAFQYNHLTIGGNRGANNVTLPSTSVSIAGNFTHNATYTTGLLNANGGTVVFNGTSAQTLSVPTVTTLSRLTLNNTTSGGGTLQLSSGALTIATTLNLTAGKFDLTTNNLTLNSGVTINTPSASSYIVAIGVGKLIRKSVSTVATLFPIGTTSAYTPVTLTNSAAADMTVGVSPAITNAVADTSRIIKLQWSIAASANVSATTVLYQFNNANMASAFSATSACDHGWYTNSYAVSSVGTPLLNGGVYTLQKTSLALTNGVTYLSVLGNTNAIQMPYVYHNTANKLAPWKSGIAQLQ